MPIREAMQRLGADQAIVALPNKSIRVPTLSRSDLLEIQTIRVRLESLAAGGASQLVTDQDIEAIEAHDAANVRALVNGDATRVFESNYLFHFSIYRAAKSSYPLPIIEGLWLKMGPIYNIHSVEWPSYHDRVDLARSKHFRIIEALKRRDSEAAAAAMAHDVQSAVDIFLEP